MESTSPCSPPPTPSRRARLVGTAPTGYSEDPALDAKAWEALHISAAFERAAEFDVIHNSFDFLPLTYSGLVDTPVVTTIHGFSSEQIVPVFEKYNRRGYYVAISDADRHERLDYAATIHHGIDLDEFALQRTPGDYLLFFGRIHPDKGTVEAIEVAERAGLPLVIAGIIQDHDYFERHVEPRLDGERVRLRRPGRPRPPRRPARRRACAAAPRQLRRAVRLQRRRGDGLWHAGHRQATRLNDRDRESTARTAFSSIPSRRRSPPSTLRARSTAKPCAHRSKGASTSSGWWTTTSPSIGASSSATAMHESTKRASAEHEPAGAAVPGRRQLLAGRTAMSWWSSFDRAEVAADFARIAAGGLDSVRVFLTWEDFQPAPDRGRPIDARAARRRSPISPLGSGSRSSPLSSPVT